jgi:hypothetical protein
VTIHRHARRLTLLPEGRMRWTMAVVGVLSLLTSCAGSGPRYQHVVNAALGLVLLLAGVVPRRTRSGVRKAVYGLATFFIGMAGVISGTSLDESFTLMTAAILAGGLSLAFGPLPRPARHAAI